MSARSHLPFRTNVGAILRRSDNRLLLCERLTPRGVWQFPQGGVDPGETHEDALWRELGEELGFAAPRDVCQLVGCGPPTNYEFADDYDAPITRNYRGQTQTLYLLDFVGTDDDFQLEAFHEPEFSDFGWFARHEAESMIWQFKRVVLEATLDALAAEFDTGFTG